MIQPIGHFRLWRALFNKPIWLKSTLEQKVILITLMSMANFKANQWEWQGKQYNLEPGQFITSLESIKANTGNQVSIQNIRTALKRFEKLEFLTYQSTKEGRLVTLVNWRDYQYVEGEPNIATNKDLTKTQQRPNKDLTTIEEGKKVNKEIKNIYMDYVELTITEYNKLLDKLTTLERENLIERLNDYIGQIGVVQANKKYKSHYHVIMNWYRKDIKDKKVTVPKESLTTYKTKGSEEIVW